MESGDEDDLAMGLRDFKRMEDKLYKEGYREGIEQGNQANLQKYFDLTVERIQRHLNRVGTLIGRISYAIDLCPHHQEVQDDLTLLLKNVESKAVCVQTGVVPEDQFNPIKAQTFIERLNKLEENWVKEFQLLERMFESIQTKRLASS